MARQQQQTQVRFSQIKSTRGTPRLLPSARQGLDDLLDEQKAKDPADVIPRYYKPMHHSKTSLSRERIRQIETIAMRKFKRELLERGLPRCDLIG